nr:leucine-rich repeat-containing protein 37A3-like [Loxodonta africana]
MSRLHLWAPWVFLTLQPLWLLVQAPPLPLWAWNLVRLTSDPPGLTEPWFLPSPNLPPESLPALTAPDEPGGSDYVESPASAPMLAWPQEFSKTLNTDSDPQLPPSWNRFAGPRGSRRFPKVIPGQDWNENEAITLRPLKSKTEAEGVNQAEGHQSFEILVPPLDSHSSKPTKVTVSPPNLIKDLAQHPQLAKVVVGTSGPFPRIPNQLDQAVDDYLLDPSLDIVYPPDNLPPGFLGSPDQPPEPPEYGPTLPMVEHSELPEDEEPSVEQGAPQTSEAPQSIKPYLAYQEAPHLPLEHPYLPLELPTEMEPSPLQQEIPDETFQTPEGTKPLVQQEAPSQPPESPQEVEPFSVQQETSAEPPELPEIGEPSPVQQGAPTGLPEPPKLEEPFPIEQETPVQTPEAPEENEPPLTQQEAQTQPLTPPNAVIPQTSGPHEVSLRPPGQNQTHHSTLSNITIQSVDVELTLTPEHMKEVQSCPTQQEAPAQPPMPPQEVKPSSSQQEAPAQPPMPPQEVEPSPVQQEAPAQSPKPSEEVEPSPAQEEASAQPPKPSEEVEPAPVPQEATVQPPEPSEEVEPSPGEQEAPVQPPNSTEEVEVSPTQEEVPALPPQSPEQVTPSSVQQEVSTESPVLPQEVKPSPTQQQTPAQTPEPPEEVEPFPVHWNFSSPAGVPSSASRAISGG